MIKGKNKLDTFSRKRIRKENIYIQATGGDLTTFVINLNLLYESPLRLPNKMSISLIDFPM